MTTYILRRLMLVPVTLFILSFGTAMVMRLTPGDVVDYRLQNSYTPERADALREQLGLNKGPFEAYWDWISNAFQGDFGRSFVSYTPISEEIERRFPVTIQLVVLTVLVQAVLAIPLGAVAAVRQNGLSDHSVRITSVIVLAVPSFGVPTPSAYRWWDEASGAGRSGRRPPGWRSDLSRLRNDLEPVVARRHPDLGVMIARLRGADAAHAAMSGSGSAVFGLFRTREAALAARTAARRAGWRTRLTRTIGPDEFARRTRFMRDGRR